MDALIGALTTAVVVAVLFALYFRVGRSHLARPVPVRKAAALGFLVGLLAGGAGALTGVLLHAVR